MPLAVIDAVAAGVAAGVGGEEQRVVPLGIEQRRQRVRFVVVVEIDFAKPARLPELRDVEDVFDTRCVVAEKLTNHITPRILLDIFAILLAYPADAANVPLKFG